MLELLNNIDTNIFYFINQVLSNQLFDKIMPFITDSKNWILLYVFLFVWLIWKGGLRGRLTAAGLILAIVISDQLSSSIIKELVSRPRPCHILSDINLLVDCGRGKSFPSSHAVNQFTAAIVLSFAFRKHVWIFFAIASSIAFSRVYVGVHYPFDITAGAAIGFLIGFLVKFLLQKTENKLLERKKTGHSIQKRDS